MPEAQVGSERRRSRSRSDGHPPYTGAGLLRLHGHGRLPLEPFLVALVAVVALALVRDAPHPSVPHGRRAPTTGAAAPPAGASPPAAASAPRRRRAPDAAILGDSYTAGANASSPAHGYAQLLARRMGWHDVFVRGLPGSGYVERGTTGRSLHALIRRTVAIQPRLVLVVAGHNDSRAD